MKTRSFLTNKRTRLSKKKKQLKVFQIAFLFLLGIGFQPLMAETENQTPLYFDVVQSKFFLDKELSMEYEDQSDKWESTGTGSLILKGFQWTTKASTALQVVNGDLTIYIPVYSSDTCLFVSEYEGADNTYGIYSASNLVIMHSDTLTTTMVVKGGNSIEGSSYGIKVDGDLWLRSLLLDVSGGNTSSEDSYGIYAGRDLVMAGNRIEATGNTQALNKQPSVFPRSYEYKFNKEEQATLKTEREPDVIYNGSNYFYLETYNFYYDNPGLVRIGTFENGSVSAKQWVEKYDSVTLSIMPKSGYFLDKIEVLSEGWSLYVGGTENVRIFRMEGRDVDVYASFCLKPEIVIRNETVQTIYNGSEDVIDYEIRNVDTSKHYKICYKVESYTAQTIEQGEITQWDISTLSENTIDSEATPNVTNNNVESSFQTKTISIKYTPKEPQTEYDYTHILVWIEYPNESYIQYLPHTTRMQVIKPESFKGKYKSSTSTDFLNLDAENWESSGISLNSLTSYASETYNSDDLFDYVWENWPTKQMSINYPSAWGNATIVLEGEKGVVASSAITHLNTFIVNYPTSGGNYELRFNWPQLEMIDTKTFTYHFDDITNVLYTYSLAGYDTSENIYISYTNGQGETISRTVICQTGNLCIYEPKGISGSLFIRGKNSTDHYVYATISDVQPIGLTGGFSSSTSFKKPINTKVNLSVASDCKITLYNKQGEKITDNAQINYFTLDENKALVTNGHEGSLISNDGIFAFAFSDNSILSNSDYTLYIEIIADGYLPYLLKSKRSTSKNGSLDISVVMKEENVIDKHVKAELIQGHNIENLTNLSPDDVRTYLNSDVQLNTILSLGENPIEENTKFKLAGGNDGQRTASSSFLLTPNKYSRLQNSYADLEFNLVDYIEEKKTRAVHIMNGNKTLANLPKLMNMSVSNEEMEKALKGEVTIPLMTNGKSVGNLGNINNEVETKELARAFDNFDITLPSTLPFTFQITRTGNEVDIKGIVSFNFLPGGDLADMAEFGNDFKAMFDECVTQVRKKKSYDGPGSNSVFVGIKGYITGKATFDPLKNKLEGVELSDIGVVAELSGSYTSYVEIPIAPLIKAELNYTLEGLLSTTLSLENPSDEDKKKGSGSFKVNMVVTNELALSLNANLGLGLDLWVASAYGGIGGGLSGSHSQKIVYKPYYSSGTQAGFNTELKADIYLWARLSFLFYSEYYSKSLMSAHKQFLYPDNSSNPFKEQTKKREIRPIGTTYERMTLKSDQSLIVENVSFNANPQYLNDESIIFHHIKEADDYMDDRIQIKSSNETKDFIENVSKPMFSFDVSSSSSNSIVAYEEFNGTINNQEINQEMLQTLASRLDIVAAVGNGNSWITQKISDDDLANIIPKSAISANGSWGAVVWQKGEFNIGSGLEDSYINGGLYMSRYNNRNWDTAIKLLDIDKENPFSDYTVAVSDNGSIIIAGVQKTGNIELIVVNASNSVSRKKINNTGRNLKLKSYKNKCLLSFVTESNDSKDIYIMALDENGNPTGISGYLGLTNQIQFNYDLVAKKDASDIADFAIIWSGADLNNDGRVVSGIYGALLNHTENNIYLSQLALICNADEDERIYSFDGIKIDNKLKIVASLGNEEGGAVIIEKSKEFFNEITCLNSYVPLNEVVPNHQTEVEFTVKNNGYLPIQSFEITIGEKTTTINDVNLYPNETKTIEAEYTIPETKSSLANSYTIKANYSNGTSISTNGDLDFSVVDLKANLLSTSKEGDKSFILIEIENNSPFPITDETVTVGLYQDIRGERVCTGINRIMISADDLFDTAKNQNTTTVVSFDISDIEESETIIALVLTEGITDKNMMDNSLIIRSNNTQDETPKPTPSTYYTVIIPEVEGVKTNPSAGNHSGKEGEYFTVFVSPVEGYSIENLVFMVNNEPLEAVRTESDGTKVYSILISGDSQITMSDVNNPVGIKEITNGIKVYSTPGYLMVENNTGKTDIIRVYSISGLLLVQRELPLDSTSIALDKGVYVVLIGNKVYKIRL